MQTRSRKTIAGRTVRAPLTLESLIAALGLENTPPGKVLSEARKLARDAREHRETWERADREYTEMMASQAGR